MSVRPELGGPDTNLGLENCDSVDCRELTGCVQGIVTPLSVRKKVLVLWSDLCSVLCLLLL